MMAFQQVYTNNSYHKLSYLFIGSDIIKTHILHNFFPGMKTMATNAVNFLRYRFINSHPVKIIIRIVVTLALIFLYVDENHDIDVEGKTEVQQTLSPSVLADKVNRGFGEVLEG